MRELGILSQANEVLTAKLAARSEQLAQLLEQVRPSNLALLSYDEQSSCAHHLALHCKLLASGPSMHTIFPSLSSSLSVHTCAPLAGGGAASRAAALAEQQQPCSCSSNGPSCTQRSSESRDGLHTCPRREPHGDSPRRLQYPCSP